MKNSPHMNYLPQKLLPARGNQSGVVLIESLVSVVLLLIGILGLIGLMAAMSSNATESKYRAEAAYLANELVGQMWVDQVSFASKYAIASGACTNSYTACTNWLAKVGQRLPGGSATVVINGVSVTVTVTWQTPGGGTPRNYLLMTSVVS